ncbi:glycerophosphodiester phosphodiesterase family protein [Vibrio agarivorans]|uniref:Glycerophosphodiester phosphodiesterase family protein n=1 Tax=Vibrio agarivorans TaxID=153622 RepID=A0ABT7Y5U4_9VIBR|nr:glycerophosphodiester phosphodiesterase family protein [Vibrio agarivorans]MDN2483378.1 glycerophosphodiester phosphodiesterase family protein [Vibrio agarivorans]
MLFLLKYLRYCCFADKTRQGRYATIISGKLGILSERLRKKDWILLEEIGAFSCHLNFRWTAKRHVEKLHQAGYQVWCYTVNNPRQLKHLNNLDAVFSDFPSRFFR